MKRALSLLRNNRSEDPHTIKNEFSKYRGEAIKILQKNYFQQILQSEDKPTQWNSSIIINIDKRYGAWMTMFSTNPYFIIFQRFECYTTLIVKELLYSKNQVFYFYFKNCRNYNRKQHIK